MKVEQNHKNNMKMRSFHLQSLLGNWLWNSSKVDNYKMSVEQNHKTKNKYQKALFLFIVLLGNWLKSNTFSMAIHGIRKPAETNRPCATRIEAEPIRATYNQLQVSDIRTQKMRVKWWFWVSKPNKNWTDRQYISLILKSNEILLRFGPNLARSQQNWPDINWSGQILTNLAKYQLQQQNLKPTNTTQNLIRLELTHLTRIPGRFRVLFYSPKSFGSSSSRAQTWPMDSPSF